MIYHRCLATLGLSLGLEFCEVSGCRLRVKGFGELHGFEEAIAFETLLELAQEWILLLTRSVLTAAQDNAQLDQLLTQDAARFLAVASCSQDSACFKGLQFPLRLELPHAT